jgi:hypothetical protein
LPPPGYWQASDGNWYPPQLAGPQPAMQTPKSGMPGWAIGCLVAAGIVIVLGIAAAVVLGVVVNEAAEEFTRQTGQASDADFDLAIESCETSEFDITEASGVITNTSTTRQGFEVEVRFTDADNTLVEESVTFVDAIDPGQSARWTVTAFEKATGPVLCDTLVRYSIFD